MAIEDFILELPSHQFTDLIHFRMTQPGLVTNAKAIAVLESVHALNRTLTSEELGWLGDLVTKLNAGDFTARDFEAASRMFETFWITSAEFKALLGL